MKKLTTTFICLCFITGALWAQIPTYVPASGLVGWYPFSGNANDLSTSANNGTVSGATLTTDRFGKANSAYSFNGTSSFISTDSTPITSSGPAVTAFTISAWVYLDSINQFTAPIVGLYEQQSNSPYARMYFSPVYDTLGTLSIGTSGASDVAVTASTYNAGGVVFYVNGVAFPQPVRHGTTDPFAYWTNGQTGGFDIGQHTGTGGVSNFKGKIDDLGLWNRELTQQEIMQLVLGDQYTDTLTTTVNDTVTVHDTVTTAVADTLVITVNTGLSQPSANTLSVYPNPAKDHLVIDCGDYSSIVGFTIKISNMLGQSVYNQPVMQQQYNLDLNGWGGPGVYVLSVINAQSQVVGTKEIVLE
jgi:Concanavalin A-like lectin/glucanases superfamily/Secretion system C-terminal sorting domain